jgi:hypothetical protein
MKLSQQSQFLLESTLKKALTIYAQKSEQTIVTDIHIQVNQSSGELVILNDEEAELACVTIGEWAAYDSKDFYEHVERILIITLNRMKGNGDFDRLSLLKPYSFVLIDEERETLAELLLVDDDTILLNDKLLKGLDEELDQFLKELLEK